MKSRIRIALVFGTRPEAIKLAPVYLELKRQKDVFEPLLWVTAQHRQMLDQALRTFDLKPDRDFDLMRKDQSLTDVTCAVLDGMQAAFAQDRPDLILVQGDTTTVLAASLAAFYAHVPIGHVEAGLRTWDKSAPYPEELNRQMTSRLADLHFAPTGRAKENLLCEGVREECIWVTGNTVIDALDIVVSRVRRQRPVLPDGFPLARIEEGRRMVLITGHRRENFGAGFESLCEAIRNLSMRYPDCEFVYPVHLNPNVRKPVNRILSGHPNIHLIEPLSYEPFVWAMDHAYILLSDSGGVQEEAPHLGKPVLVMREITERPEAVTAGTSKLVGTDRAAIVREASLLLEEEAAYSAMSQAINPFGDGNAAVRIAEAICGVFG